MSDEQSKGKWIGRRPKGLQDTHSFKAFLKKGRGAGHAAHLARNHRGLDPRSVTDSE